MRVLARVFGLLCAGLLLCFDTGCSAWGLPHANEVVYRDVPFSSPGGHQLAMDLYVPKAAKPAPVVIWIFGGSWKIGNKGYHVNLRNLTSYGIALASIQYRLSGEAKYPAQLDDCLAAVTWLRKNGSRYGIDPAHIGISGESAGGHLAALTGTVEGKSRIQGVCALYPPTDLVKLTLMYNKQYQPTDMERLLGGLLKDKMAEAKDASPVNHVSSSSPPFLIFHGADDTLVPPDQSHDIVKRLRHAGVPVRLVMVPGKGHWFLLSKAEMDEVAAFFWKCFSGTLRN